MNGYITLKEVCEMLGLSRRAVQGYEKAGLIRPSARNKYGHLLYDEKTVSRIAGIQYCQKLGFELKDILEMTKEESGELCRELENRLGDLQEKKKEIRYLIDKTREIVVALKTGEGSFPEVIYEMIKEDL